MNIKIKKVTIDDAQLLFEWANDSETRYNSFNSAPIEWNNHITWLNKQIISPNASVYLVHLNNRPIGVAKFNSDKVTVIGITVAPDQRGKGLGSEIIKIACHKFWKNSNQNIFAYIKKDNLVSKRVFEKAGFIHYKEQMNNDKASLILILKKDANQ